MAKTQRKTTTRKTAAPKKPGEQKKSDVLTREQLFQINIGLSMLPSKMNMKLGMKVHKIKNHIQPEMDFCVMERDAWLLEEHKVDVSQMPKNQPLDLKPDVAQALNVWWAKLTSIECPEITPLKLSASKDFGDNFELDGIDRFLNLIKPILKD